MSAEKKGWLPALFRPVSAAVEAAARSQETRGAAVPTVAPPPRFRGAGANRAAWSMRQSATCSRSIRRGSFLGWMPPIAAHTAWNTAKRLTGELFNVLPGELEVALAVHGGGAVHTFTPFVGEAGTLRRIADGVRCKAGNTAMLDILERAAATDRVRVVVYIGDSFEESEKRARRLAKLLRINETRVIILADCGGRPFFVLEPFQMIASITSGAVLPFDVSAFDELAALLQAVSVLAVGGETMLEEKQATMPAAPVLLERIAASKQLLIGGKP